MSKVRKEFQAFLLTDQATTRLTGIRQAFSSLLDQLDKLCPPGRELALVKTKLEEACMFATRSVAVSPQFQAQLQNGAEETYDQIFSGYERQLAEANAEIARLKSADPQP